MNIHDRKNWQHDAEKVRLGIPCLSHHIKIIVIYRDNKLIIQKWMEYRLLCLLSSPKNVLWSEERSWERSRVSPADSLFCACANVIDHVVNNCQRGAACQNKRVALGSHRPRPESSFGASRGRSTSPTRRTGKCWFRFRQQEQTKVDRGWGYNTYNTSVPVGSFFIRRRKRRAI